MEVALLCKLLKTRIPSNTNSVILNNLKVFSEKRESYQSIRRDHSDLRKARGFGFCCIV